MNFGKLDHCWQMRNKWERRFEDEHTFILPIKFLSNYWGDIFLFFFDDNSECYILRENLNENNTSLKDFDLIISFKLSLISECCYPF